MIRITLICFAFATLTGCATWEEMPLHEKAFHTMNVIDTGQTINIARRPDCFREVGFPTQQLIGSHPSETEVYLTSAAFGLAYHYGRKWFDRKVESAPAGSQEQGWWVIGRASLFGAILIGKGATIANNADIGLSPWGNGCSEPGSF